MSSHNELWEISSKIKDSKLYQVCSNMYATDRDINDIITNIHNTRTQGNIDFDIMERRIWTIFWINPFIAIKIVESCTLVDQIDIYGALKSVWYALINNDSFIGRELENRILNNKMDFTILMIEICFSNTVQSGDNKFFCKDVLDFAYKAHDPKRGAYLSARNLQHIYYHIPDKRKITFLNWFWEKYRYEKRQKRINRYGIATTEKPERCIQVLMNEIRNDYLWKYYEMDIEEDIRSEYISFVNSVIDEKEHTEFLEIIFGKDDLERKIERVLGRETRSVAPIR